MLAKRLSTNIETVLFDLKPTVACKPAHGDGRLRQKFLVRTNRFMRLPFACVLIATCAAVSAHAPACKRTEREAFSKRLMLCAVSSPRGWG